MNNEYIDEFNNKDEVLTFNVWHGWNGGSSITYTVTADGLLTVTESSHEGVNTKTVQLTEEELAAFVAFVQNEVVGKEHESQMVFDAGATVYAAGKEIRNVDELNRKVVDLLKDVEKNRSEKKEEEKEETKDVVSLTIVSGWKYGSSTTCTVTDDGKLIITTKDVDYKLVDGKPERTEDVDVKEIELTPEELEEFKRFVSEDIAGKEYEDQVITDADFIVEADGRKFRNVEELYRKMLGMVDKVENNHSEEKEEAKEEAKELMTFTSWSGWNGGSSKTYTITDDGKLTVTSKSNNFEVVNGRFKAGETIEITEIKLTPEELEEFKNFIIEDISGKEYEDQMTYDMGTTLQVGDRLFQNVDELNKKFRGLVNNVLDKFENKKEDELSTMINEDNFRDVVEVNPTRVYQ